jgi:predicted amidohydrolase
VQLTNVATTQFHHSPGDKASNLSRMRLLVDEASVAGVDLLVFPEMCVTGYWHVRHLDRKGVVSLSEPIPDGPTTRMLQSWADETGMSIGAGLIERTADDVLYNSYVVAQPGGVVITHRKLHTFVSEHMASGDTYTVFDLPNGTRAGILTCWDNNLTENVRITALKGAEVLIAPHQTGGCDSRSPHAMGLIDPELWHNRNNDAAALASEFAGPKGREWLMRWLPARAHDNGIFVVFANGIGLDDNEVRTGNAMILDPYGRILAESMSIGDDIVIAELDPQLIDRSTGQRWMRGRRPELYGALVEPSNTFEPRDARFSTESTS